MSDVQTPEATGLPAAINDSLAVVWRRYLGRRPTDVNTVIRGSRVECVLGDVVEQFTQSLEVASEDENGSVTERLTTSGYKREAAAAVAKLTRRRVMAVISDHNEETDIATEIFILDRPARQPRASLPDAPPPQISPA